MLSRGKIAGYFWVKISIAFGLILGLLLLAQTVGSYYVASRTMTLQKAQSEAISQGQLLSYDTRRASVRDSAALTPVIDELIKAAPEKVAWIRVLASDGKVIAAGGRLGAAPKWKVESLRAAAGGLGPRHDVRTTELGDVLISIVPLGRGGGFGRNGRGGLPQGGPPDGGRGGPPPDFNRDQPAPPFVVMPQPEAVAAGPGPSGAQGRGRGPNGPYVETAIYLDGVSVSFTPLLMPLSVGSTAAVALLVAVILIGLRFPHYISGKQYEEELALARRVQRDLFPREGIPTGNLEFAARFIPSRQVGGDLYDIFETDDGGVAMVLGDVSGKGLSAALLMGVVQGAVRTSSDSGLAVRHEYAAERLNHLMCMKTARERFVSLFWCYLNPEGTRLSYINAGHLPALLVRERFGRPDVWRLEQGGGPVLGVLPDVIYKQAQVDIEPGDLLVVFSDGVSEAANAAGAEFGEEGIIESVKREWRNSAGGVCDGVLADVRTFLGGELPHDDQTLMVVRLEHVVSEERPVRVAEVEVPVLG
jgi:stage II sporulation SpoE-like protein